MKALAIIGSIVAYVVILGLSLLVIHYVMNGVRSAFRSVFSRKSIDKL